MAFTRDKRAMGWTSGAAMVLCLLAAPAVALTPPPCERVEGGMRVSTARPFGHPNSGFVTEKYFNAYEVDPGANGTHDRLPVPVPQLEKFGGYRIIDCQTREFLAIDERMENNAEDLENSPLLLKKIERRQPFTLADVKRSAEATYRAGTPILTLRETEQTCSCKEYGGQ